MRRETTTKISDGGSECNLVQRKVCGPEVCPLVKEENAKCFLEVKSVRNVNAV
jgi:hypothetical protein